LAWKSGVEPSKTFESTNITEKRGTHNMAASKKGTRKKKKEL